MPHSRSNADLRQHNRTDAPVVGASNLGTSQGTPSAATAPPLARTTSRDDGDIGERVEKRIQGAKDSVGAVKDLVKKLVPGSSDSFP